MHYTELHLHTHYSLLDGLNTPAEYLARASEIGMTHLAITDHGTLSGHRQFQTDAKAAGITPILGCEMYISATDRFDRRAIAKRDDNTQAYNHIGVLAQNETGLRNLNRMSELAWTEGFYSKPRIDMDLLEEYQEGLIVLSGCLNGLIAKSFEKKLFLQADQYAREFKRIFGDRFFIEIQGHNPPELNEALLEMAEIHKILPVVTSDCHYAKKEDLWIEEALLIMSTKPKKADDIEFSKSQKMELLDRYNYLYPDRQMSFQKFDLFLHSAQEHATVLAAQGIDTKPITNTMVVADMIEPYPFPQGLELLPKPRGENPNDVLWKKIVAGAKARGTWGIPEYDERRQEEWQVIVDKGFAPYFIPVANTVAWALKQGIFIGPGRGSGAGFLINYELFITGIDPLKYNLLAFRFINPERNDSPDVDTDIQRSRRPEIKTYNKKVYGDVASIATWGTFQGNSAVRAAAKVFLVPISEVNRALKGADWPNDWFDHWLASDRGKEFVKKYPEVLTLAEKVHGRLKSQGLHAGGLILSREAINDYAPMQTTTDPNDKTAPRIPVVALTMEEVADIGFVKYDYLGLKALDIVADTLASIKERHGIDIDLYDLDLNDSKVYETLSKGYTKGVFQCEANPYTSTILDMGGVRNFDELAASNALVRPGSMKSTAGKEFIARKLGEEPVSYPHQDMEWFTKETYGVVIYQEQVMLCMTELAGMRMATADKVRKIIGKKRDVKEFEQFKNEFIQGASQKVSKAVANRLWHDFEAHAGYSFNKSHAVAYSMLSFWTAWLKEYYPLEFMAAVLSNEDDKDSLLDYLIEARRIGLRILLPHVNKSGINFEIQTDDDGDYIRFGLSNIKYISGKIAPKLLQRRPFDTYQELLDLVDEKGSGVSTRVLGSLNKIGAAVLPGNPARGDERDNLYEYLNIPAFKSNDIPPAVKVQFRPLADFTEDEAFVVYGMVRKIKTGPGWARVEMVDESGSAGIFAGEHTPIESGYMYVCLVSNNRIVNYHRADELNFEDEQNSFFNFLQATEYPDVPDGMWMVVSFTSRTTKAGNKMADVVLADREKELVPAMVFPREFYKAYTRMKPGTVVDIKLAQTDNGAWFVENIL